MRNPAGTVRSMRWYPGETPDQQLEQVLAVTMKADADRAEPAVVAGTAFPSSWTETGRTAPGVPATMYTVSATKLSRTWPVAVGLEIRPSSGPGAGHPRSHPAVRWAGIRVFLGCAEGSVGLVVGQLAAQAPA